MNRPRTVALIGSASAGVWLLLALTVVPRLHLETVTLAAAAAIITVQAGTLAYALVLARAPHKRGRDHLHWLAQLAQILGLLGTVAGFMLEMRALGGLTTTDPAQVLVLIAQLAKGLSTAMVSTFCGVLASVAISLALHVLED